mmetsp:Transcript_2051/g.3418  ORF Transcript_2051/g.3418 Transcript_2051/m.3418 type:complete len:202 (-) Transcript_2051:378-983(-)
MPTPLVVLATLLLLPRRTLPPSSSLLTGLEDTEAVAPTTSSTTWALPWGCRCPAAAVQAEAMCRTAGAAQDATDTVHITTMLASRVPTTLVAGVMGILTTLLRVGASEEVMRPDWRSNAWQTRTPAPPGRTTKTTRSWPTTIGVMAMPLSLVLVLVLPLGALEPLVVLVPAVLELATALTTAARTTSPSCLRKPLRSTLPS